MESYQVINEPPSWTHLPDEPGFVPAVLMTDGKNRPFCNIVGPPKNGAPWKPLPGEPAPKFEYGPLSAFPIHLLNKETNTPLIDSAYDAIAEFTGSNRETLCFSREQANNSGNMQQMGNGPNCSKFELALHNARFASCLDKYTTWSDKST